MEDPYSYTIIGIGDFNFPDLWNTSSEQVLARSINEIKLVEFLDSHFLAQYVDIATRNNNILDLFITNNDRLLSHVKSDSTILSDHNFVEIILSPKEFQTGKSLSSYSSDPSSNHSGFQTLDLFKADYDSICSELSEVRWVDIWNESSLEDFPALLHDIVFKICKKHSPIKNNVTHKSIIQDRSYRTLQRKLKKLKSCLKCIEIKIPYSMKIEKIKTQIQEMKENIKVHTFNILNKEEQKAISKIKTKPKHFYKYVKKFSKVKQSISQLFDCNDELVTESKQIADILQNQFVSVFSNPANTDKSIPPETQQRPTQTLSDFTFNIDNIISAIDEININSSCPDYSIPAPVLKHCKSQLANPLFLMWTESLKTGHVPAEGAQRQGWHPPKNMPAPSGDALSSKSYPFYYGPVKHVGNGLN